MIFTSCKKNESNKETKTEEVETIVEIEETTENPEFISFKKDMEVSSDIMIPYKTKISGTSDKGIAVYWKEPENVDGYVLYRSYKKKNGYKIIAVLGNTPYFTTYYDDTFNKDARKVYYKVRSYRDEDGRIICSRFSNVMTAKYKKNLKLSKSNVYMFSDTSKQINAFIGWGNASEAIWESSDTGVATVTEDGVITAISKGEAVITCTAKKELNNKKDEYQSKKVNVTVDREDVPMLSDSVSHRYTLGDDGIYRRVDYDDLTLEELSDYDYNDHSIGDRESKEATILLTGDLMAMGPTIRACRDEDGNCNFNGCYDYVKPILQESDLALGNLETLIASEYSYSTEEGIVDSWPQANAPATFLDALMYAGFDGFPMSNNHNADCGTKGVESTIETLNKYEFPYTGIYDGSEEDRFLIYEVNGMNVGVISYTTKECGFNTKEESWDSEDVSKYLNYYSKKKAKKDIKKMKDSGAEFCIVYMHWGIKNYFVPTDNQRDVAKELADMGFDYIAGSHSHTVQPYERIEAEDGREVPCIYSMGDFNAHINQIAGNRDAVMMYLNIRKDDDGNVKLFDDYYIPFYTYDRIDGNPYVSIPLNRVLYIDYHNLDRADEFKERIKNEIGMNILELAFK